MDSRMPEPGKLTFIGYGREQDEGCYQSVWFARDDKICRVSCLADECEWYVEYCLNTGGVNGARWVTNPIFDLGWYVEEWLDRAKVWE